MQVKNAIDEYMKRCLEIVKECTIEELERFGEECVIRARDRTPEESWNDQTGNLRSSIGYMVLYDGKSVSQGGFQPTPSAPKGDGSKGQTEGEKFLAEAVMEITKVNGFSFVLVAGMNYGDEVEARDNKDVLASTELWARGEWEKRLLSLDMKIQTRINQIH